MDFLRLAAYLKLDKSEYEESLKDTEREAKGFGSKLASGLKSATKVIGAATVAGAAAVGKLAKDAVAAYGNFQQLEGGIQTLFGKDAQTMMGSAAKAFKTAGVSANQYMEMAIQSSASMISSLGGDTARAAELMDMSIIDMSDNVNKMGTTMEAVQNAYRGFSRGNFTMLDNLALGFAGTKQGMQELLATAKEISGIDYNIGSYADIVEAIHVVQTEMGITGTTAKEAGDTITGSAGSAKAAWEDLKVAMASGDDAKLTAGIDNLIASVTVMGENLIPILERSLEGIGKFVERIVPIISERLPGLVEKILPGLLSAASSLVQGVVKALPGFVKVIANQIPKIIKELIATIRATLPDIIALIPELFSSLVSAIAENIPALLDMGMEMIEGLAQGITDNLPDLIQKFMDGIVQLLNSVIEKLPEFLERGKDIIHNLVEGIVNNIPRIIQGITRAITSLITTIGEHLPDILTAGVDILMELIEGIISAIPVLIGEIPNIIFSIVETLLSGDMIQRLLEAGVQILGKIFEGIINALANVGETVGKIISAILGAVVAAAGALLSVGGKIVGYILDGIKNAWSGLVDWVESGIEALLGDVNAARDEALAALDETNKQYESAIERNRRNHEKYGTAHGANAQQQAAETASHYSTQYTAPIRKQDMVEGSKHYAKEYKDSLNQAFDSHSPSRLMRNEVGRFIGQGLALGIQDGYEEMGGGAVDTTKVMKSQASPSARTVATEGVGDIVIPVYIGNTRLDEIVVTAGQRANYRSGGR